MTSIFLLPNFWCKSLMIGVKNRFLVFTNQFAICSSRRFVSFANACFVVAQGYGLKKWLGLVSHFSSSVFAYFEWFGRFGDIRCVFRKFENRPHPDSLSSYSSAVSSFESEALGSPIIFTSWK